MTKTPDPILDLITAYNSALAYVANQPADAVETSDDEYEALAARTHYPLRESLIMSTEAATTAEGAREALKLSMRQRLIGDNVLADRLVEVAHGFLAKA